MAIKIQTIKDISDYLADELSGLYPAEEAKSIAKLVTSSVLGITEMHKLYLHDIKMTETHVAEIIRIGRELRTGKPIQYIIGETTFYGCRIKLNNSTLIPRQETEELVDLIIRENKGFKGRIIDFGTGSGCIAIALAVNLPGAFSAGTDISSEALKMAVINAEINHARVDFYKEDILVPSIDGEIMTDIVVSNPPYVRHSEKKLMHKNVLDFEPELALFVDDADPLIFYRAILQRTEKICKPGAKVYFEINEAFGNGVLHLMESYGFTGSVIIKDLNGKDRMAKGEKNGRK